jgi:hypothetical protein
MNGMDYKAFEEKNFETFRERVIREGAEGWRVISMAIGPHGTFTRSWRRRLALKARGSGRQTESGGRTGRGGGNPRRLLHRVPRLQ